MTIFIDKLVEAIRKKRSHVIVGLDPDLNRLPGVFSHNVKSLKDISQAIYEFNTARKKI